jgi:hypothetical protein
MSGTVLKEPHTSTNGVVRINKRGLAKFQFGEDEGEPVLTLDVIAIYDAWHSVIWELRDKDGVLPNDKQNDYGQNRLNFVQSIVNDAYKKADANAPVPTITRAEAEMFIAEITKKAEELRAFFYPPKETPSSLPGSSATEIRFSQ